MEYAKSILNEEILVRDDSFNRFVGYKQGYDYHLYFDTKTVSIISKKITELLMGVDRYNRPIIVPDKTILNIMDSVKVYFRPQTGDIYSRYNKKSFNKNLLLTNCVFKYSRSSLIFVNNVGVIFNP